MGLGSQNLLSIAIELLNLKRRNWPGLRLGLIEELEAHIHPQRQLGIIENLQLQDNVQFILTTHSPNLASKVKLDNLIICEKDSNNIFPMGQDFTKLGKTDYAFLERFLDVTKSNLFFAKGVVLVEGWSEELLLPALAKRIGHDLTKKGISIVNVGNTAFLRYAKIFQRKINPEMAIPVSVVTDIDIKPEKEDHDNVEEKIKKLTEKYDGQNVKTFVSPHWTLEYCIALSEKLRKPFYKAVLLALLEQKQDSGTQNTDKYQNAIDDIDNHFNGWTGNSEDIALLIYKQVLGEEKIFELCKEKVKKPIIAQYFAKIIDEDLEPNDIKGEDSIQYLIKAIEYACGTDK